jgi:hypothetical protein
MLISGACASILGSMTRSFDHLSEIQSAHERLSPMRDDQASVSAPLLAAALSGLLCLGCGSDDLQDGGSDDLQDGGSHLDPDRKVTLSRVDHEMTREQFEEACDMADGKLEVHPHCGGFNSCKGFSYDSDANVYTEHTCQGLNTCTGYSCVVL